jgi:uroporphyrinogen III methyltransferase/synthase
MTVRSRELIAHADVILYDRLVPADALAGARDGAELIFVGKEGGGSSVPQAHTQQLMIERAQAGLDVVRLKGGDPFVFGRGGEEALALREAAIPYEVVPGVSAGVAAPAYAGIPVTHRGLAGAVAFVTGHAQGDAPLELDWRALARFPGTLVFYMGVGQLEQIAGGLIDAGRGSEEPAAVIERGTLPEQRAVVATLADIAARAREANVRAPAVTVVGPVAALSERIAWLDAQPLRGITVAVTRARAQASELAGRLGALGASVVQAPAIRVQELDAPAIDPSSYDWIFVMSANAAEGLIRHLARAGEGAMADDALGTARVAAIGPGTARALAGHGIVPELVAERSVSEGVADAARGLDGLRRALIVQARGGRDVLAEALRAEGVEVEVHTPYETVAEPLSPQALAQAQAADYITFTSSSTVRFFLQAAGDGGALSPQARVVSIGPVTSEALADHGVHPHVEATTHDLDGLVAALLADAAARR